MDGIQLSAFLESLGYKVKAKTKTSITLLVSEDRITKMMEVSNVLKGLGAKIDPSIKGSSIGGILVGNVKILIKAEGRTGGLDVEAAAIRQLEEAVLVNASLLGRPLSIRVKNKTIDGVIGVEKTAGTPKSDFHLVDENGNPLLHISHKKGSTPKDFQQWGGFTEKKILDHKEVKDFIAQCQERYSSNSNKIPPGESVFKRIKDKDLKMMAVYGVEFDRPTLNENRVDVLLQGDPGLKQNPSNSFSLTATGHVHYRGDDITGGFEPVLALIYKGDRDQFGIKGARASIYPIGGRAFKEELK